MLRTRGGPVEQVDGRDRLCAARRRGPPGAHHFAGPNRRGDAPQCPSGVEGAEPLASPLVHTRDLFEAGSLLHHAPSHGVPEDVGAGERRVARR